jgi:hypothetical protein
VPGSLKRALFWIVRVPEFWLTNTFVPAVSCEDVSNIAFVQRFLKIRVAPGTSEAFGKTPVRAVAPDSVLTPQVAASKVLPEVTAKTESTAKGEKPLLFGFLSAEKPEATESFVVTRPRDESTRVTSAMGYSESVSFN